MRHNLKTRSRQHYELMADAHNTYQYSPLRVVSEEFRLVKIVDPSQTLWTIRHFSLHDAPPYTALSYTWGGQELTNKITVDGNPLYITKNLKGFLNNFRSRMRRSGGSTGCEFEWIWIDAICINQDDLQERSSQVSLMKKIFEKAQSILIWLGGSTHKSGDGISLIAKLATLSRKEESSYFHRTVDDNLMRFGSEENHIDFTLSEWDAMGAVLSRSYWRRAWIFQESTTTAESQPSDKSQHMHAWCGYDTVALEAVFDANRFAYLIRQTSDLPKVINHEISAIELYSNRRKMNGHGGRMIELLMRMRFFKATNPRDKIYAVLPLADKHDRVAQRIKPDYTQSVETVYTHLTATMIIEEKSLDILACAGIRRRFELPSWVPDWTLYSGSAFGRFQSDEEGKLDSSLKPIFKASGDTELDASVDLSSGLLHVRGVVVDRIFERSGPRPTYPVKDAYVAARWRSMVEPDESSYMGICTRVEAFEKILTADFQYSSSVMIEGQRGYRIDIKDRKNFFRPYDISLNHATYYRLIIITEKGYMGVTSHNAEPGDVVCLLFGHQFPVILRQSNSEWLFIGEAYIHGIMDGEAIENVDVEKTSQVFDIR